jgi:hypothetical protein
MAFSKMAQTSSSFLALLVTKVTGRHEVFQDGSDSLELGLTEFSFSSVWI